MPLNIITGANSANIFANVPANTGSGVAVGGTTVAVGGSIGRLSTDGTQRHHVRHDARLLLGDTFEVANGAREMDRAQDVIAPV